MYVAVCGELERAKAEIADILRVSGILQPHGADSAQIGVPDLLHFRDRSSMTRQNLSLKEIISFIRKNGPKLKTRLGDVAKWVTDIRDTSIAAYETKYHVALSKVFTEEQMAEAGTSMLLQMALENRYASVGLYHSYRTKVKAETIKLDVDLINDKAIEVETVKFRNSVIVRYRFIVPWPSKPHEPLDIVIEGPFDLEKSTPSLTSTDRGFVEACYAALMNAKAEFRIQSRAETYAFRSQVPFGRIVASSSAVLSPLTELLVRIALTSHGIELQYLKMC